VTSTFNRFQANGINSEADGKNLTVTADMIGQGLLTFICQANNTVENSTYFVETKITFVTGVAFFCSSSQLSHVGHITKTVTEHRNAAATVSEVPQTVKDVFCT
jgi:hypothetical protein